MELLILFQVRHESLCPAKIISDTDTIHVAFVELIGKYAKIASVILRELKALR